MKTMEKISFAIENANIVNENPNSKFATVQLDFFASGDNLNDLYISEDTLLKTADTIKYCPVVWKYDKMSDDIYTHDDEETPCGFIPETSKIEAKKLPDGRTMLSTMAYIWKRYTGPLLNIFKRDGGKKPVSVEMVVKDYTNTPNGKKELLDFEYQCVTILGSRVTPAIPMASATVLSFASEYEKDFEEEFGEELAIKIPKEVKDKVRQGLSESKDRRFSSSASISIAKHLLNETFASESLIDELTKYFSDKKDKLYIDYNLHGGEEAEKWIKLIEKRNKMLEDKIITFPYEKISDINPALKGIDPPITLGQANEIARQADAIGTDEEKNGWAIAIANFKKSHHVENGKWVKNEVKASQSGDVDFAKDELGKSEAIEVDKSKDKVSNSPWGDVDKTELMHKVLSASNYKSLVHDVYLLVEDGWEEHPSKSLKYPVMQLSNGVLVYNKNALSAALGRARQQGETEIGKKVQAIQKKLGLLGEQNASEEKKESAAANYSAGTAINYKEDNNMEEEKIVNSSAVEIEIEEPEEEKMKFELPESMSWFVAEQDEEEEICAAKQELAKPSPDFGKVINGLFSKMNKMFAKIKEEEEKAKVYMAENESLRKMKEAMEQTQKDFAVKETLDELEKKVIFPEGARQELEKKADEYSIENLENWKTYCKAISFDFVIKTEESKEKVEAVGLPFVDQSSIKKDIWDD